MLREQVDFLDAFMPTALHVLVRFGRWDEILDEPQPADYLPMSRAIWHYARTLAYAATDRVDEAEAGARVVPEAVKDGAGNELTCSRTSRASCWRLPKR